VRTTLWYRDAAKERRKYPRQGSTWQSENAKPTSRRQAPPQSHADERHEAHSGGAATGIRLPEYASSDYPSLVALSISMAPRDATMPPRHAWMWGLRRLWKTNIFATCPATLAAIVQSDQGDAKHNQLLLGNAHMGDPDVDATERGVRYHAAVLARAMKASDQVLHRMATSPLRPSQAAPPSHMRGDWLRAAFVVSGLGIGLTIGLSPLLGAALTVSGLLALVLVNHTAAGVALMFFLGCIPLSTLTEGDRTLLVGLGGVNASGIMLVMLCAALAVAILARGNIPRLLARFWPHAAWLAYALLALTYSNSPGDGARFAAKLVYPFLVMCFAAEAARRWRTYRRPIRGWIAGGLVASAIAFSLFLSSGLAEYFSGTAYRYTSLYHPSPFSFYLLVLFAFCYSSWRITKTRSYLLLSMIFGFQVLLSMVRISIFCFVIVICITEILVRPSPRSIIRSSLIGASILAIMLFALLTIPLLQQGVTYDQTDSISSLVSNINDQGRSRIWSSVYESYVNGDSITGMGLGSTTKGFRDHLFVGGTVSVVHNEYLRLLYETGILGILLFIGMLCSHFRQLLTRRDYRRFPILWIPAVSVLVCYSVVAITDNPLDYYQVLGQYVFGLIGILHGFAQVSRTGWRTVGKTS